MVASHSMAGNKDIQKHHAVRYGTTYGEYRILYGMHTSQVSWLPISHRYAIITRYAQPINDLLIERIIMETFFTGEPKYPHKMRDMQEVTRYNLLPKFSVSLYVFGGCLVAICKKRGAFDKVYLLK